MSGGHLVRGGRLVDPSQGIDEPLDVLIEDGVVSKLAEKIEPRPGDAVTEAQGLVVAPGLIDLRVHLGEPGFEYRETVQTALRAAAAGGFTAVVPRPDSDPVHDERSVTELLFRQADRHPYAKLHPVGAVSRGLRGEELAEMGEMAAAGVVAFSDGERGVRDPALLRRALYHSQHFRRPVMQSAEDPKLRGEGVMHEGAVSTRLGLPGVPAVAEEVVVARDLLILALAGGHLHFSRTSTPRSLELVREGRRRGLEVTCDVTVHHLVLTDEAVAECGFSTATRVSPPLRPSSVVEALVAGLADGTVDAITSDHTPFHADEKDVQFSIAPPGMVGLETALSLCLDRWVHPGHITLSRLIDLLSCGPARLLGLPSGGLAPGKPADLTLIDLDREVTVAAGGFESKARNTPFEGWKLRGAPVGTFLDGRPVEL